MERGRRATVNHGYERNGTIELFAAMDSATDIRLNRGHTGTDVLAFLRQSDRVVPADLDVHVGLDYLPVHKAPRDQVLAGMRRGAPISVADVSER